MGDQEEGATRAGYVAIAGLPNVGKSTLMNALVGEKLSIVTPRAQTTRERVMGILTTDTTQIVFVDTPGLLEPRYLLQRSMQEAAERAVADADLVLLLLDAARPEESLPNPDAIALLQHRPAALLVATNKVDEAPASSQEKLSEWSEKELGIRPIRVSALHGTGVQELLDALVARLPESPFFHPADELAIQPVRFFVAELVRETIFEEYEQEVPYSTVVKVEEFREERDPLYIRATIFVERDSQKHIVIGTGGAGIRRLGSRARAKIEEFLGRRVYLDLWVKTMHRWRAKRGSLKHLGYGLASD